MSQPNWRAILTHPSMPGPRELSRRTTIDVAPISRAINHADAPLSKLNRTRLLKYLVTIYPTYDDLCDWLIENGWELSSDEKLEIGKEYNFLAFQKSVNIPIYYIDRKEIDQIVSLPYRRAIDGKRYNGELITGMGGVGKTTLVQAALQHRKFIQEYSKGYIYLQCEGLSADDVFLALQSELDIANTPNSIRLQAIKRCFSSGNRLIVFDGLSPLEVINQLVPLLGSNQLIITTRFSMPQIELDRLRLLEVPISEFNQEQSVELLSKGSSDQADGRDSLPSIAQIVRGLPLALEQIIKLKQHAGVTWTIIQGQLNPSTYPLKNVLDRCFELNLEKISVSERMFLDFAALFARPRGRVEIIWNCVNPADAQLMMVVEKLAQYSLLKFQSIHGHLVWEMHPLLREYLLSIMDREPARKDHYREVLDREIQKQFSTGLNGEFSGENGPANYWGQLLLQEEFFAQIEKMLSSGRCIEALNLLIGSQGAITMFEGYKPEILRILTDAIRQFPPSNPAYELLQSGLKYYKQLYRSMLARAQSDAACLPGEKTPLVKALFRLAMRHYLLGDSDGVVFYLNQIREVFENQNEELTTKYWERYYSMLADLALVQYDEEAAVNCYGKISENYWVTKQGSQSYYQFHAWPRKRLDAVRKTLLACLEVKQSPNRQAVKSGSTNRR